MHTSAHLRYLRASAAAAAAWAGAALVDPPAVLEVMAAIFETDDFLCGGAVRAAAAAGPAQLPRCSCRRRT